MKVYDLKMCDLFASFFARYFSKAPKRSICVVGLDYTGKTTLLHVLKNPKSEIVVTIPTIGLIVESVDIFVDSRRLPLEVTCLDVGGCEPRGQTLLTFRFTTQAEGIVWMVDSADRDRLGESVESLRDMLQSEWFQTDEGKTRPVLILATKQDLPSAMPVASVREAFAPVLRARHSLVFGIDLTRPTTNQSLDEAFSWFTTVITGPASIPSPSTTTVPSEDLQSKILVWASRAETDAPADEFLDEFNAVTLTSWDHYTHIRIAYVILTKYGRQKGKNMIFEGLQKFISQSPLATGRAFHETMTYFWIQMVHLGIVVQSTHQSESSGDADTSPGNNVDFVRFLLLNPTLADGMLWATYYSKEVIMTPEAKSRMVLPDKKPLPNVVDRDSIF